MRRPTDYEIYLQDEMLRYGLYSYDDNDYPAWLIHECSTFHWIFNLSRRMWEPVFYRTVSNQILSRIANIKESRYRKIRDLSPVLKESLECVITELDKLNTELQQPDMWKQKNCLSDQGIARWEQTYSAVWECTQIEPDAEWRERWEKEMMKPYCTRLEAEMLAVQYVKEHLGIDLSEKGYHYSMRAKNGIFKMRFGNWERNYNARTVTVNMLTRQIENIT